MANRDSDDVTVINTATDLFITTIPVGDRPRRLELDTVNNLIYVLNQDSNTVSVIDGGSNSVIATLPVGQLPDELQLNSANGSFYVANVTSGTVSVIADVTTPPFTNESLKDSWGFSAGALSLPILEVGIMTFDGSGGCIITSTLNTSGTVTGPRNSETCTNSMSPNGTGSIAVQFSDDVFPVLLAFSILEGLGKKRDVATAQRDCLH